MEFNCIFAANDAHLSDIRLSVSLSFVYHALSQACITQKDKSHPCLLRRILEAQEAQIRAQENTNCFDALKVQALKRSSRHLVSVFEGDAQAREEIVKPSTNLSFKVNMVMVA